LDGQSQTPGAPADLAQTTRFDDKIKLKLFSSAFLVQFGVTANDDLTQQKTTPIQIE